MATKKKKERKRKIHSLVLLLFLTVVILSTATYAWFTSNKTVTVNSLDVHVEAKSGLQISANGFDWKTVITNGDITGASTNKYTTAVNQIPSTLEPVSSAGKINTTNGYLKMFNAVIGKHTDGDFTLTTTEGVDANGATGNYLAFDLFLKTETGGQIYLTTDSNVVPKGDTGDTGLKNAARVAFVVSDAVASTSELSTIQALKADADSDVYIWEPNYDVHTANGVTAAAEYGITTTVGPNADQLAYDGVLDAFSSPIKLKEATADDNGTHFATVTPKISTKAAETDYKNAFSIGTGVTKVRVYMWIEGQDVDCENNASGSDISFNVQFSSNASADGA